MFKPVVGEMDAIEPDELSDPLDGVVLRVPCPVGDDLA